MAKLEKSVSSFCTLEAIAEIPYTQALGWAQHSFPSSRYLPLHRSPTKNKSAWRVYQLYIDWISLSSYPMTLSTNNLHSQSTEIFTLSRRQALSSWFLEFTRQQWGHSLYPQAWTQENSYFSMHPFDYMAIQMAKSHISCRLAPAYRHT